ncbi:MAG: LysR substrate-binding domain-containing protein, partial [Candidatus Methylacidiphilales bacterium]|nr:LysR substrate-binding domain-containing protein [Candidatus Methylacidiphilales bacterium]
VSMLYHIGMNERPGIREMECFVAVAENLNFARAAQSLRMSQPPLSRHIQRLEEKLGVGLFNRSSRHVELTAAGTLFLSDIREVLRLVDRASDSARRTLTGQVERLNIGFVGALLEGEMIGMLRAFRSCRVNCQIHLHDMLSPDLISAVLNKQLDGAFIGATPRKLDGKLSTVFWKKENFMVAMPKGHALENSALVDLRDFSNENWITLQEKASPALYHRMLEICDKVDFHPTVVDESDRWTAIIAMVALGEGVCLIPESATKVDAYIEASNVVFKPLLQADAVLERSFLYNVENTSLPFGALVSYLRQRKWKQQVCHHKELNGLNGSII